MLPMFRRVPADAIAECDDLGETPEEIAQDYRVALEDVKTILAYYHARHTEPAPTRRSAAFSTQRAYDHNVPSRLARYMSAFDIKLDDQMGWAEIQNGRLLRAAEDSGFNVLLTGDQSLPFEQNMQVEA